MTELPEKTLLYKIPSGLGGIFWIELLKIEAGKAYFKVFNPQTSFHGMPLTFPLASWKHSVLTSRKKIDNI